MCEAESSMGGGTAARKWALDVLAVRAVVPSKSHLTFFWRWAGFSPYELPTTDAHDIALVPGESSRGSFGTTMRTTRNA
jgi:hypothetical protein